VRDGREVTRPVWSRARPAPGVAAVSRCLHPDGSRPRRGQPRDRLPDRIRPLQSHRYCPCQVGPRPQAPRDRLLQTRWQRKTEPEAPARNEERTHVRSEALAGRRYLRRGRCSAPSSRVSKCGSITSSAS